MRRSVPVRRTFRTFDRGSKAAVGGSPRAPNAYIAAMTSQERHHAAPSVDLDLAVGFALPGAMRAAGSCGLGRCSTRCCPRTIIPRRSPAFSPRR